MVKIKDYFIFLRKIIFLMTTTIFFIGFMGCGKSYVGKKVADQLGYKFVDLDAYIVENEGLSIFEIFEKYDENHFRLLEKKYLAHFFNEKNTVVATGGGAPCFFDNLEKMNENGLTIYLFANTNILFERLEKERNHRPLLKGKSDDELKDFIAQKLNERSSFYDQAEAIFEVKNDDHVVNEICQFLTLNF
jgi:shikimate kinase